MTAKTKARIALGFMVISLLGLMIVGWFWVEIDNGKRLAPKAKEEIQEVDKRLAPKAKEEIQEVDKEQSSRERVVALLRKKWLEYQKEQEEEKKETLEYQVEEFNKRIEGQIFSVGSKRWENIQLLYRKILTEQLRLYGESRFPKAKEEIQEIDKKLQEEEKIRERNAALLAKRQKEAKERNIVVYSLSNSWEGLRTSVLDTLKRGKIYEGGIYWKYDRTDHYKTSSYYEETWVFKPVNKEFFDLRYIRLEFKNGQFEEYRVSY